MSDNIKILLVDDEDDILEFLSYNLEAEGYKVIQASNGIEAIEKLVENPDLVLLDVNMPEMNGFEVCKQLRSDKKFRNLPVIFLTARTSEIDELKGLELEANDYIKKPVSPKLLTARVKANLRGLHIEGPAKEKPEITLGVLKINRKKFSVDIDGKKEFFPKKEFEILYLLAANPGKVFSRAEILTNVWGTDIFVVDRTVDVHIRKIREKLGKYAELLETIKGVGYKIQEP